MDHLCLRTGKINACGWFTNLLQLKLETICDYLFGLVTRLFSSRPHTFATILPFLTYPHGMHIASPTLRSFLDAHKQKELVS